MSENINNTRNETKFASVKDPISMYRAAIKWNNSCVRFLIQLTRKLFSLHQGKEKHKFQF